MAETPAQEAAAGVIEDIFSFAEEPQEETDVAPEDSGEQQQEEEVAADLIPDINWETPEELREVMDAPDFDDEEEEEVEEPVLSAYESEEFEDPEKKRLAKQLARVQKQLAWEKDQKVKVSRKGWAEEAKKYYQFSNPEVIQATSRRAFLKQAEAQHMAVAKVAKPVFDKLAKEREKIKEQALAEARAEAEQRWGRPTTGPSAPGSQNTHQVKRERLESSKGLKEVIKNRLTSGEVNL